LRQAVLADVLRFLRRRHRRPLQTRRRPRLKLLAMLRVRLDQVAKPVVSASSRSIDLPGL
jgi:hypothetical protein